MVEQILKFFLDSFTILNLAMSCRKLEAEMNIADAIMLESDPEFLYRRWHLFGTLYQILTFLTVSRKFTARSNKKLVKSEPSQLVLNDEKSEAALEQEIRHIQPIVLV